MSIKFDLEELRFMASMIEDACQTRAGKDWWPTRDMVLRKIGGLTRIEARKLTDEADRLERHYGPKSDPS